MQRHRSIIIIALALALSLPSFAVAEWAGRGFYEPDTHADKVGGYNFVDPDTSPDVNKRQVYFSAFVVQDDTQHNPNVAAMGSNHIAAPWTNFNAFLGVWKDCNDDGYIGMIDSVILEYRAELLEDDSICSVDAESPHNDGEWVQEFLWIGPDDAASCGKEANPENDTTPLNIADDCARVWGDIGLPEDEGAITCPLVGWSRGTFQSTGGLIRYADCIATYRIYGALNTVGDSTDADETLGIQIDMHDTDKERPDESGSIVNQKNPYGDPAGDSFVTAFDCGAPIVLRDPTAPEEGGPGELRRIGVKDPTGEVPTNVTVGARTVWTNNSEGYLITQFNNVSDDDGQIETLYTPMVPTTNVGGTPAGTVNSTLEATDECERNPGPESSEGWTSDIYDQLLESDFEPSSAVRRDHDITMEFFEGSRGCFDVLEDGSTCLLGENQPDSLGLVAYRDFISGDSVWYGTIPYTASRNGLVNIDSFAPQAAQHFTFYSYVSQEAIGANSLDLATVGYSNYGSFHCGGAPTGAWDCNDDNWWRDGTGKKIQSVWEVAAGQEFNLRDIDCYDETYERNMGDTTTRTLSGTFCDRSDPI